MTAGLPQHSAIGPYRVVDHVGSGGMGAVYRVAHRATGRVAAAKVMGGGAVSPRSLERFRNEARILQTLTHPAIARMYEFLDVQGAPCLVMEYVDGETLEQLLRTHGAFPLPEALRIFSALVDAVGYIHQRGIIHRDLKANNVKIDGLGRVKLLDFGIAMAEGAPRLTSTGNVVGTLIALAPEQLRTGRAEPRSDIWSLGVLFYELLTGRLPFEGGAPAILSERILRGTYTPPSELRPELPRDVDRIVGRCLRVRPDDRYASAEALLTDLQALQSGERPAQPFRPAELLRTSGEMATTIARQWQLSASVVMALAAAVFLVLSLREPPPRTGSAANARQEVVPARPGVTGGPGEALTEVGLPREPRAAAATTEAGARLLPPVTRPPDRPPAMPSALERNAMTLQPLLIRVSQGTADVYIDNQHVGTTPYTLRAPVGTEVQLLLRRAGCNDLRRPLRIEEGMSETFESLPGCRAP